MPGTRPPHPLENWQQIVELMRAGRRPQELAQEIEPTAQTIRSWVKQADPPAPVAQAPVDERRRHDGLTMTERQELIRLRRETNQLRLERQILAKAAATTDLPRRGTCATSSS